MELEEEVQITRQKDDRIKQLGFERNAYTHTQRLRHKAPNRVKRILTNTGTRLPYLQQ